MKNTKARWIWQQPEWPNFYFDQESVSADVGDAYRMHGLVEGKAAALGLNNVGEVVTNVLADEALATAAIEGERIPMDVVRSSVMRRLGLATSGPTSRHVDGLVAVLADATKAFEAPLDEDRLCRWQAALFPGGASGIRRIAVGRYRDHDDPMQLVSGPQGHEVVHYEAPPSKLVPQEMRRFLAWFAETTPRTSALGHSAKPMDCFARAAIAHAWFESIHPFEDGNGRIGRAIVDMAIAQHFKQPVRMYSLSRQLKTAPKDYYDALNQVQRSTTADVTSWVKWFARQCSAACHHTSMVMDAAIAKRQFWELHEGRGLQDRQRKVLQRLLDDGDGGFLGGLNVEKYIQMTKVAKATATRDLAQMVSNNQLWSRGVGKAVRYYVNMPGWTHGLPPMEIEGASAVQDLDAIPEVEIARSEAELRATLTAQNYVVHEVSGEVNRQYFGPVVAASAHHVAQDLARQREVVIHNVHQLDRVPAVGDRIDVKFKNGRAIVIVQTPPHHGVER